ncbi:MAG: hypothetical protein ABEI76_08565 [Halobacteriales archaeon]
MSADTDTVDIAPVDGIDQYEQAVLKALPVDAVHVADSEAEHYDAVLEDTLVASRGVRLFGMITTDTGTPVDLKTCQRWITDRHAHNGRRRGRWKFDSEAHEALAADDGGYLLAVLEDGEVVAWAIVHPDDMLDFLGWTPNGDGEYRDRSAQLRWAAVFPPEWLDRDDQGGDQP